ncbi:DUF7319 domain-containing protein [Halorubrum sp. DTA98]|uniref:DUF7319 domain-containing protein n=1 Tax=Halorubrum sp. DTA98 TaxID=3402163 RepID=UPI003AAB69BE
MDDASTRSDADDASTRSDADDAVDERRGGEDPVDSEAPTDTDSDIDELRKRVESEYDFDDFGPSDMARMSPEEWDAVFDPETWITGDRLLDRVEAELKSRIARRELFGILERVREDGSERVLVYSDEGYAMVRPNGDVTGQGTVLRDVEPVVALAAMESYDVPEPPDDWSLPSPESVPQGSGEFGNLMIQVVAAVQLIAGVALLGAWLFLGVETIFAPAIALLFLLVGAFLFVMVANARLSDRFRAEEYRNRLRTLRDLDERPAFVPLDDESVSSGRSEGPEDRRTGPATPTGNEGDSEKRDQR